MLDKEPRSLVNPLVQREISPPRRDRKYDVSSPFYSAWLPSRARSIFDSPLDRACADVASFLNFFFREGRRIVFRYVSRAPARIPIRSTHECRLSALCVSSLNHEPHARTSFATQGEGDERNGAFHSSPSRGGKFSSRGHFAYRALRSVRARATRFTRRTAKIRQLRCYMRLHVGTADVRARYVTRVCLEPANAPRP